jgi:hypothetical protein
MNYYQRTDNKHGFHVGQQLSDVHVPIGCSWHNAAVELLKRNSLKKADVTPYEIMSSLRYEGVSVNRFEAAKFLVWALNKQHLIGGNWTRYCSNTADTSGINEHACYKYTSPPRKNLIRAFVGLFKTRTWRD